MTRWLLRMFGGFREGGIVRGPVLRPDEVAVQLTLAGDRWVDTTHLSAPGYEGELYI